MTNGIDLAAEKPERVVIFDGLCNLCNGTVRFIARRDRRKTLQFISMQSPEGIEILSKVNLDAPASGIPACGRQAASLHPCIQL